MAEEQAQQTLVEPKQVDCLAVFEPVRAIMARAKEENEKLVFDYKDPKGEKAARSHIQNLRHIKTKIADAHKEAKVGILKAGREIDGLKNELTGEVEGWIGHHKEPLDRIQRAREEAEAEELRKIQEAEAKKEADRLADLERREAVVKAAEEKAAADEATRIAEVKRIQYEKHIEEEKIFAANEAKLKAEAKAIAEAEEKEQIAEQVRIQAEQEAKRQLKEAEQRRLADIEAVKAKAKAEAEAKEFKRLRDAEEEEARKLMAAARKAASCEEDRKRQANKKHQKKVHDAIEARLTELGLDMHYATNVLAALKDGTIPHVRIEY